MNNKKLKPIYDYNFVSEYTTSSTAYGEKVVVSHINHGLVPISGRYFLDEFYNGVIHGLSLSLCIGIMTPF